MWNDSEVLLTVSASESRPFSSPLDTGLSLTYFRVAPGFFFTEAHDITPLSRRGDMS